MSIAKLQPVLLLTLGLINSYAYADTVNAPGIGCDLATSVVTDFTESSTSLTIGGMKTLVSCPIFRTSGSIDATTVKLYIADSSQTMIGTDCTLMRKGLISTPATSRNGTLTWTTASLATISFRAFPTPDTSETVYAIKCTLPAGSTLRGYTWTNP